MEDTGVCLLFTRGRGKVTATEEICPESGTMSMAGDRVPGWAVTHLLCRKQTWGLSRGLFEVHPESSMGLDAAVYRDNDQEEQIASVRLGNSAMIAHLFETVQQAVPTASIILTRVLYSGSHSGDSLPLEGVRQAKRELEEVAAQLPGDPDVQAFIAGFGTMIDVALRHERPITF